MVAAERIGNAGFLSLLHAGAFDERGRDVTGESFHVVGVKACFLHKLARREDTADHGLVGSPKRRQHRIHHQPREILIRGERLLVRMKAEHKILRLPACPQNAAGECGVVFVCFYDCLAEDFGYAHERSLLSRFILCTFCIEKI